MARARNIKPGLFRNADLVELPVEARLLFVGLWTLADREGRLEDRPKQIKMEIYPADNFDCGVLLAGLVEMGFIKRYTADGKRCIFIVNFLSHQSPHGTEKDSELPCEDGFYTVNERTKLGHITGKFRKESGAALAEQVINPVDTGIKPGIKPVDTALNPESGFLNPDYLIPDSLNPDDLNPDPSSLVKVSELTHGDDEKPKSPAEWIGVFAEQHGVDVDHRNFHDRKKFWPLATAWSNAGVTVSQMRAACAKAHEDAKEPIAWLPAYADRVLASMQSEKKTIPRPQAESFKERDTRIARERWEEMTGRTHPDLIQPAPQNFIDSPSQFLEIAA